MSIDFNDDEDPPAKGSKDVEAILVEGERCGGIVLRPCPSIFRFSPILAGLGSCCWRCRPIAIPTGMIEPGERKTFHQVKIEN